MTADRVDAAVEAIVRRDPTLGEWARVAADGLIAGEGEEVLAQAFVQDFLWYRLPAKYPERAWFPLDARVPPHATHHVRLEVEVHGTAVTIVECRAPWRADIGPE